MNDVFIEHIVRKKPTSKEFLLKILIIVGVVVLCAALFIFAPFLGQFMMFAFLLIFGSIYGAYLLLTSFNVEFEFSVTNGDLDIDRITAQRKRKRLVSLKCKEFEVFKRYKAQEHVSQNYKTRIMACSSEADPDIWCAVANTAQGGKTLVVFNATQRMLEGMKPYLPRQLMVDAFKAQS